MLGLAAAGQAFARDDLHSPRRLALSEDGAWLAAAGDDKAVRIWVAQSGKLLHTVHGDQPLLCVSFGDGKRLLFAGGAGVREGVSQPLKADIRAWKLDGGKYQPLWNTIVPGDVPAIVVDPKNRWIAAATRYGAIHFLDAANGKCRRTWHESGNGINDLALLPDGRTLVAGGQRLRLWDLSVEDVPSSGESPLHLTEEARKDAERRFLRFESSSCPASIAPAPNGHWFAALGIFATREGYSNDLALIDAASGRSTKVLASELPGPTCVAASPGGTQLAVGFDSGAAELWSPTGGKQGSLKPAVGRVRSLVFLPDAKRLGIAGEHGSRVEIRNVADGRRLFELFNHRP
jgi:WD40 repeat protein